jgi:hypothetical protein
VQELFRFRDLRVKTPIDRAPVTSGLRRQADILGLRRHVSKVPCVDGSELARAFFTFCSIGRCSHVFGLLTRFT